MSYKNWPVEKTINFINEIHINPALWDVEASEYRNKTVKNDLWNEVARKFQLSVNDAQKKLKCLRTYAKNEHKKLKSGDAVGKKSPWFAYEAISFILDRDSPDIGMDSMTPVSEEEELEDELEQHDQAEVNKPRKPLEVTKRVSNDREDQHENHIAPKKTKKVLTPLEKKAFSIIKNAQPRDDCSIYGEYLASELRKLKPKAQTIVKHLINTTLFEASMGKYDGGAPSASTPVHSGCDSVLSSEEENVKFNIQDIVW